MENFEQMAPLMLWLMPVIFILIIWELVWKLIAMWKAARNNEKVWFICIALINTVGILPIIYIVINKKKGTDNAPTNL